MRQMLSWQALIQSQVVNSGRQARRAGADGGAADAGSSKRAWTMWPPGSVLLRVLGWSWTWRPSSGR
jgi:hypothetical protein